MLKLIGITRFKLIDGSSFDSVAERVLAPSNHWRIIEMTDKRGSTVIQYEWIFVSDLLHAHPLTMYFRTCFPILVISSTLQKNIVEMASNVALFEAEAYNCSIFK